MSSVLLSVRGKISHSFLASLSNQALEDLFVVVTRRTAALAVRNRNAKFKNAAVHNAAMLVHNQWMDLCDVLMARKVRWPDEAKETVLSLENLAAA